MMELPPTRAGHIGRALSATAILLFLAMPIVSPSNRHDQRPHVRSTA